VTAPILPLTRALDTLAQPSPAVAMLLRNAARARKGTEEAANDEPTDPETAA
jgi:hypothetical protein